MTEGTGQAAAARPGPARSGSPWWAPGDPDSTSTYLADAIGGTRGVVDATVPTVAFVAVNALAGLTAGLVVAIASAAALLVLRVIRREPVQQAFSGLFGVLIAALFARHTHSAKGFFLPNILRNIGYFALAGLSLAVRRPLLAYVVTAFDQRFRSWRSDPGLRRAADWATVVWMAVFAVRAAVQAVLYAADRPGWLAAANLMLGIPLFVVAILATMAVVGRVAPAPQTGTTADPVPAIEGEVVAEAVAAEAFVADLLDRPAPAGPPGLDGPQPAETPGPPSSTAS